MLKSCAALVDVCNKLLVSDVAVGAILAEAALSYLGLGTQPPQASWGRMLSEAQTFMEIAPGLAIFPGLAIALAVLGFNLLGDGLQDLWDPKATQKPRQ